MAKIVASSRRLLKDGKLIDGPLLRSIANILQGEVQYTGIGDSNPTKHEPPDSGY